MSSVEDVYSFLDLLTSVPVAPFYENALISLLISELPKRLKYSVSKIPGGILIRRQKENYTGPKLYLSAHLDHPGFHIYGNNSKTAVARKAGRIEIKNGLVIQGFSSMPENNIPIVEGKIHKGQDEEYFLVKWAKPAFGINFSIVKSPILSIDNKFIHCRSLDDHIGCALILAVLQKIENDNVIAVLNTAEEEGMIGSIKNMENNLISKKDIVISVEATPHQKEARIGSGAVIRSGDALEKFTTSATSWLKKIASTLPYEYQVSRPTSGNTEGAVYASYGMKVAGISIPINNYHNKNMQAESAKISDIISAYALLAAVVKRFQ